MAEFTYYPPFPLGKDETEYRLLTTDGVRVETMGDHEMLVVDAAVLTDLARQAMHDVSFYLRESHNALVAKILQDPEASENDKYVACTMLRNAQVAAEGQLPVCQDTGTATLVAKKGQLVFTGGGDEEAITRGMWETYQQDNLRYSQTTALSLYEEKNTGDNMPPQLDIYATDGAAYKFLFLAKGGGSANKSYLFQETKALLTEEKLVPFLTEKMKMLGTAACPPYHLAFVIGGTSAEACLKTVKLASAHWLDELPKEGNANGQAFRDVALEDKLLEASRRVGFGAQFGGKYFAHDVRVIRLPRHGASCPVGMGVSCSADRNIKAKITKDGVYLEKMDTNPGRWLEGIEQPTDVASSVQIDLDQPMAAILAELSKHPVKTRVSLTGTMVVARDLAHARLKEMLDSGEGLPDYFKNHPVYYAGPAKTPAGLPSGSFGPTTAGRMDPYVDLFQAAGASMVMLAKGNRSGQVTDACKKHGGFYLGSIGGPAAILAKNSITKVEVLDFEELGMEAVWKIEVKDFPAFILVDDKGNDFFKHL